jgi:hypothetical protein
MPSRLPPAAASQLAGCSEWVMFESQEDLARAVGYLLGCHRHNFAVLPDSKWTMVMSDMALKCLQIHLESRTLDKLETE